MVLVCWGLNLYLDYIIYMLYFNFIIELTSWEKLEDDIKRILWLEDLE